MTKNLGNTRHGDSGTRLYHIWVNMRSRCRDPNQPGYKNYGGRGVKVCPEWSDFVVFRAWALSSGYADELSIERIEVNGDYGPENCTWATAQIQNENRRCVSRAPDGELWLHKAIRNGITKAAYRSRLNERWPIELAATHPLRRHKARAIHDG